LTPNRSVYPTKGYYVNVPTNSSTLPPTKDPYTIECIIKVSSDVGEWESTVLYHGSAAYATNLAILEDSNVISISREEPLNYDSFPLDTWMGLTITHQWNNGTSAYYIYVNGILVLDVGGPGFTHSVVVNDYLYIGNSSSDHTPVGHFKGTIGEVRLWKTVLSDSLILSNHNATKGRYGL
jgi:hypothetical protein